MPNNSEEKIWYVYVSGQLRGKGTDPEELKERYKFGEVRDAEGIRYKYKQH